MTRDEMKNVVSAVCSALQETREIELNAVINSVIDLLIKLESISDKEYRLLFLDTLKKEFNSQNDTIV